jgi:hypothetical protein
MGMLGRHAGRAGDRVYRRLMAMPGLYDGLHFAHLRQGSLLAQAMDAARTNIFENASMVNMPARAALRGRDSEHAAGSRHAYYLFPRLVELQVPQWHRRRAWRLATLIPEVALFKDKAVAAEAQQRHPHPG